MEKKHKSAEELKKEHLEYFSKLHLLDQLQIFISSIIHKSIARDKENQKNEKRFESLFDRYSSGEVLTPEEESEMDTIYLTLCESFEELSCINCIPDELEDLREVKHKLYNFEEIIRDMSKKKIEHRNKKLPKK